MTIGVRKIVHIDVEKCNGCGICVDSCAEGAIAMVGGKAVLVSDTYCDGLGDCLGPCPTGAITLVDREAQPFDAESAERHVASLRGQTAAAPLPCGCPGLTARALAPAPCGGRESSADGGSQLMNWPVQLRLVPPSAPYLKGAELLLCADCVPVAVPDFHARYLRNRPVIIACPKLEDNEPQIERLAEILQQAHPSGLCVLRMEVPCCGGLVRIAEEAMRRSGLTIPLSKTTIGTNGSAQ